MVNKMKIFRQSLLGVLATGLLQSSTAVAAEDPVLLLEEGWIRAMPPGMNMTAGFGRLRNLSDRPLEILGFSSPAFGEVSLHLSETLDGVSRMREIPTLRIEAGASVELAPGGYHLMLMLPREALQPDQPVTVVLTTADGDAFSFTVPVERR